MVLWEEPNVRSEAIIGLALAALVAASAGVASAKDRDSASSALALDLARDANRPVGAEVVTSKGGTWVRVARKGLGEAWRDEKTGLIWGDRIGDNFSHRDATELGKRVGARLPTRDDFLRAEASGMREVLPWANYWAYWASTLVEGEPDRGYAFAAGGIVPVGLFQKHWFGIDRNDPVVMSVRLVSD